MKIQNKTTTIIMTSLVIGLVMLSPMTILPNINAQIPDKSSPEKSWIPSHPTTSTSGNVKLLNDAALKKAGYVPTPMGYLPPECVYQVGNNAQINQDGSIDLANGKHLVLPPCKYHVPMSSTGPTGTTSPTTTGWVEAADVCYCPTSPPAIQKMSGVWTVPPAPTTNNGQTIYLWIGLQPNSTSGKPLIQPVLQWGQGTHNFWEIDSWYCDPSSSNCVAASPVLTSAGNTITGTMTGSSCNAITAACNWSIQTTDGTHTTTLGYNSAYALYWLDGGILEVWNVSACSDYPARKTAGTTFNSFTVKDTGGNTVTPTWSGSVGIHDGCNESVSVSGSTATLYYGN